MTRVVLLAGGSGVTGAVIARTLLGAGDRVVVTGRSAERLSAFEVEVPGVRTVEADATSLTSMTDLAARLTSEHGGVDTVIPLVGGWRGGGGLAGQSDADLVALLPAFEAVRATSRAFDAALQASGAGRFAIVSSTAVARPLAGGANYAAVKAASEAWTRSVAQGFAKAARDGGGALRAAAVVLRAKSLDPAVLASRISALSDVDAAEVNDRVFDLDV